ncbi:hypothetical protein LSH36_12g23021 [Paralvinella palmiformis]|uniref:Chitin-binding type-2 domain-containing protein n=1 Tax=Paralvinella palmiformis TaxID=53620 RepID=A0AAD9NJ77_9ANNE|nr:hypothetical protein LSH36_12g23021 [Paralvinella palmiformis]
MSTRATTGNGLVDVTTKCHNIIAGIWYLIENLSLDIRFLAKSCHKSGYNGPEDAPPPCGDLEDCSLLSDGSYPDMATNCTLYFTCLDGNDLGLQPCNTGTVFDVEDQICDWPENVKEPCGTIPTNNDAGAKRLLKYILHQLRKILFSVTI